MLPHWRPSQVVTALLWVAMLSAPSLAQKSTYRMPPQVLADLIDAPPVPRVSLSPDNQWLLYLERPPHPPLVEVAQPELRLAGLRINPVTNGPSRSRTLTGLTLQRLGATDQTPITGLPDGARLSDVRWSPDARNIAFVVTSDDQLTLWAAPLATGAARQISPPGMRLNATYGTPYAWLTDGSNLVARTIPTGRCLPPAPTTGPIIKENLGRKTPARTLQGLLRSGHDETLYTYYTTSQIVQISLDGTTQPLGQPAVYRRVKPAPGGQYLLIEQVHRPYSRSLHEDSFPRLVTVWDLTGTISQQLADMPLQDQIPLDANSVASGPREFAWRQDVAAEVVWAEALDGGDGRTASEQRDRIFTLTAPFDGEPQVLTTLAQRFGDITWGNGELALVSSWWWDTRNIKVWRVQPDHRQRAPVLLEDRSWQNHYADPGNPVLHPNQFGRFVILTTDHGQTIYLDGDGATPAGKRPFLDTLNLATGATTRLFQSTAPFYENPVEIIDPDRGLILTRRESPTQPPNYFLRYLKTHNLAQQTFFPDPNPQLRGTSRELITYQRDDGVALNGTLYLPPGYDRERDGPLPCLMWAYPTEFKNREDAGQVTDSPYRFTRVWWGSPLLFLARGYAVFDHPSLPIVGEGDTEPNDTYVEQLVAGARAAVEAVAQRGVVDRQRIAIGGHSYGAFMTANLLAHSDLFCAGVARSGAYNRTLTPFGFQAEERTVWQAPALYQAMSPFLHADQINEPLLLVHGQADNNSGTFPLQSERMFDALKGLGATVRLVLLPHESHSYRARESIMHLLWETSAWLDRYCRDVTVDAKAN